MDDKLLDESAKKASAIGGENVEIDLSKDDQTPSTLLSQFRTWIEENKKFPPTISKYLFKSERE
jgi:hypothetical protein